MGGKWKQPNCRLLVKQLKGVYKSKYEHHPTQYITDLNIWHYVYNGERLSTDFDISSYCNLSFIAPLHRRRIIVNIRDDEASDAEKITQ